MKHGFFIFLPNVCMKPHLNVGNLRQSRETVDPSREGFVNLWDQPFSGSVDQLWAHYKIALCIMGNRMQDRLACYALWIFFPHNHFGIQVFFFIADISLVCMLHMKNCILAICFSTFRCTAGSLEYNEFDCCVAAFSSWASRKPEQVAANKVNEKKRSRITQTHFTNIS